MPSNSPIRHLPVGGLITLAILAGTTFAQAVPASATADKPAARAVKPVSAAVGLPQASPAPAVRVPALPPARQDENARWAVLIAKALDQTTDLSIENKPIGDAFELLSNQTGIPIEVEPGTLSLLPYDSQTRVTATIKNQPLRDSLTALLRPIGLKFDVENRAVMVRPVPPLRRIAQRATWKDLALLETLSTTPWSEDFAKSLKFQFLNTPAANLNRDTLLRLAANVGQGTAGDILEAATDRFGWTWYPSGDLLVVLPKTRQVERQLEQRISADYSQTSLQDTLVDLAQRAGVPLRFDPGALSSLSPFVAERFYSGKVMNMSVRQVLEIIAGQTGLSYYIDAEGLRIAANQLGSTNPTPPPPQPETRAARGSVIAFYTLPGPKNKPQVTVFLREDDFTDEQLSILKAKRHDYAAAVIANLSDVPPATQPHD